MIVYFDILLFYWYTTNIVVRVGKLSDIDGSNFYCVLCIPVYYKPFDPLTLRESFFELEKFKLHVLYLLQITLKS